MLKLGVKMKIKGIVVSGSKEGAYFIGQDVYQNQFPDKLGFTPYTGTLNIEIIEEELSRLKEIPNEHYGTIKGSGNFGDVKFIKAYLNHETEGAVIFPEKTHHPENLLEFVAPTNLRKKLNLKDGDSVIITFTFKTSE
jgi:riboflavin kinase